MAVVLMQWYIFLITDPKLKGLKPSEQRTEAEWLAVQAPSRRQAMVRFLANPGVQDRIKYREHGWKVVPLLDQWPDLKKESEYELKYGYVGWRDINRP